MNRGVVIRERNQPHKSCSEAVADAEMVFAGRCQHRMRPRVGWLTQTTILSHTIAGLFFIFFLKGLETFYDREFHF